MVSNLSTQKAKHSESGRSQSTKFPDLGWTGWTALDMVRLSYAFRAIYIIPGWTQVGHRLDSIGLPWILKGSFSALFTGHSNRTPR